VIFGATKSPSPLRTIAAIAAALATAYFTESAPGSYGLAAVVAILVLSI
jgi:hypothetical protein